MRNDKGIQAILGIEEFVLSDIDEGDCLFFRGKCCQTTYESENRE